MENNVYLLATSLFAALVGAVLGLVLLGLRHGLGRTAPTGAASGSRLLIWAGASLLMWLGLTAALAAAGQLQDFEARPPLLMLLLPVPLVAAVLLARSAAVGRLLDALSPAGLIYLQSMRIVVELVLWLLFLAGVVPRQMTFEGLNWDVLTGLTAPVVAYFCFTRPRWPWQVALGWNIVGLALLVNIVAVAMLSTPMPFRQFMNEPANTVIAHFPMVWLPVFIVPVAYTLHVLSIRQLWRRAQAASRQTSAPVTSASSTLSASAKGA
ncbi:hypothetical protein [Hymenobacter koreensis]